MRNIAKTIFYTVFCGVSASASVQAVQGNVDTHSHLGAHLPYPTMNLGGSPHGKPNHVPSHKHKYQQSMFESYLRQSQTVLFVNAALDQHVSLSGSKARRSILEQFRFVEGFVKRYPDRYAFARTPAEARREILRGKKVFVHAIEGMSHLVKTRADARFWASQGVALATPIHLSDNEYGSARFLPGASKIWHKRLS